MKTEENDILKSEKKAAKEAEKAEKKAVKDADKAEKNIDKEINKAVKEAEKAEKKALKEAEKAEKKKKDKSAEINKEPEFELEIPDISMYDMVKQTAEKYPDAYAYDYMGTKLTYTQLIEKLDECASALDAIGVKSGDIVTICMPNTPEALICIYALNKIGAIANAIHPLSAEEEISRYVISAESKVMLAIDICNEKIESIIKRTSLETVIVVSPADSLSTLLRLGYNLTGNKVKKPSDKRFITWKKFMSGASKGRSKFRHFPSTSPAVILHSGGTTGIPKEIVLSSRNFNTLGIQSQTVLPDINKGDGVLAILPVFHAFGLGVCFHITLSKGGCVILIPRFEAKKFAQIMNRYKPSMVLGVPTLYEALINAPGADKLDLSYLKYAISGGDSLSAAAEERLNNFFKERNAKITVTQGYGLSESLGPTCLAVKSCYKPGSIGKPFIGNRICVVTPGTQDVLPAGEDGEICICGPSIMLGYRNNEKETNEVLQIHSDGRVWLHTGDIGVIDEDGCIFYKTRLKRLIITSGYNVYPQHVEKVIEEHEAVLKCTVIGVPHPYKVEVGRAFIVLKNGYEESDEIKASIKEHCKKNLAHYCIPKDFEYRKSLPQTRLGKTDFAQLKKETLEKQEAERIEKEKKQA